MQLTSSVFSYMQVSQWNPSQSQGKEEDEILPIRARHAYRQNEGRQAVDAIGGNILPRSPAVLRLLTSCATSGNENLLQV